MKNLSVLLVLVCLLVSASAEAAVLYPPSNNQVRFQGTVVITYGFAFLVNRDGSDGQTSGGGFRFECDTVSIGCGLLLPGDNVLIQGHLNSFGSCRVDGPDVAVKVNFIQKWNGASWVMVTTQTAP